MATREVCEIGRGGGKVAMLYIVPVLSWSEQE